MAKIKSKERVIEYSKDFKVKIVQLTEQLNIEAIAIADVLGLHPVMVYRWRQEYREGKLKTNPTRKVSMALDKKTTPPLSPQKRSENEQLKRENARLKKENQLLKKWQGYLTEVRQKNSDS